MTQICVRTREIIELIFCKKYHISFCIFSFKDPQPITEKFKGIYDATQEKIFCAQKNYLIPNPTVMGVEDCLYLYVYRPMVSFKIIKVNYHDQ